MRERAQCKFASGKPACVVLRNKEEKSKQIEKNFLTIQNPEKSSRLKAKTCDKGSK